MRFIVFLLLFLVTPCIVLAQEEDAPSTTQVQRARELYQQGVEAYNSESWVTCAYYFEQSFTQVFAPNILYNIGLCYDRAAHVNPRQSFLIRGVRAYSRYLVDASGTSEEDVQQVTARIEVLRSMRHRLYPEESLPTTPTTPAPAEGEETEEAPLSADAAAEPLETLPVVLSEPPSVSLDPPTSFNWTYTTVGAVATGVLGIVALSLGAAARSDYDALSSGCGETPEGCPQDEIARVNAMSMGANVLFVMSGVLLVGTGIAFVAEFVDRDGSPTVSSLGLQLTRSF